MKRKIIVTIDSLVELFADYCSATGDIPSDTRAVSLQVNPAERGKFRIIADSPQWKDNEPPVVVNFEIKRIYSV